MDLVDLLINRLQTARKWTLSLIDDTDAARWFDPPAPGIQHIAWQLGHLAASQFALINVRCFGKKLDDMKPSGYMAQFGRGSSPKADKAAYAPLTEIRGVFDRVHQETVNLMKSISPADLSAPTYGDPHPMFENRAQCFGMVAMHEAFHAGQIALTRRIFGKAPLR